MSTIEILLHHYGCSDTRETIDMRGGIPLTRAMAEHLARRRIGQNIIMPGQLLRILDIRFEDGIPDVSKGRVIAVCEPVEAQV
jgi:hypothetical protein